MTERQPTEEQLVDHRTKAERFRLGGERRGGEQASHASRETGDSHQAKIVGGDGIG